MPKASSGVWRVVTLTAIRKPVVTSAGASSHSYSPRPKAGPTTAPRQPNATASHPGAMAPRQPRAAQATPRAHTAAANHHTGRSSPKR